MATAIKAGKTYCFRSGSDPSKIVCALTISNDSIRIYDLPRSRRDYMKSLTHHEKPLRRYPGVLIGRLGDVPMMSLSSVARVARAASTGTTRTTGTNSPTQARRGSC